MSIRWKMIIVVLPLIIVSLFLTSTASYYSAVNGVTRLAQKSLGYKEYELRKYADAQWQLLEKYDYTNNPQMLLAAQIAVIIYAQSIVQDKDNEKSRSRPLLPMPKNGWFLFYTRMRQATSQALTLPKQHTPRGGVVD